MIDPAKTYKTRDGRAVRIYAVDGGGDYPVHGAVMCRDRWSPENWMIDGQFRREQGLSGMNLIEQKPRIQRAMWLNVYPYTFPEETCVSTNPTREEADKNAGPSRLACVRVEIDVEHGHGLTPDTTSRREG